MKNSDVYRSPLENDRSQEQKRDSARTAHQPVLSRTILIVRKRTMHLALSTLGLVACDEMGTTSVQSVAQASVSIHDAGIADSIIQNDVRNMSEIFADATQEVRVDRATETIDGSHDASQDAPEEIDLPEIIDIQSDVSETQNIKGDGESDEKSGTQDDAKSDTDGDAPDAINNDTCIDPDPKEMNGMNAINLVGQVNLATGAPIYTSGKINNGEGSTNARGLYAPQDVEVDTTHHRLFVADSGNNRVLVFLLTDKNILTDYTADYVLGQPDFISNSQGTTSTTMAAPTSLLYDAATNQLYVADYGNKRVLLHPAHNIVNGQGALKVLGQPDFTSSIMATTQSGFRGPRGLTKYKNHLFVSDAQGNNRVLVFDVADGITNGENAVKVIGQKDFVSNISATSQNRLSHPYGLDIDPVNGKLLVADPGHYRVMVFDIADGITNGENAVKVIGQKEFTTGVMTLSPSGISYAYGLSYDHIHKRVFISNTGYHRVTLSGFDNGISNGANAVSVIGQTNFTSIAEATTQNGLHSPYGVTYIGDNNQLVVSDTGNHRVAFYIPKNPCTIGK